MLVAIQVLADDGTPVSRQYEFGTRLTLTQALMLIQALMTLSGEFDDTQLDKVVSDRIAAEFAENASRQPVLVKSAR